MEGRNMTEQVRLPGMSPWIPFLTSPLIALLAAAVIALSAWHRSETSEQLQGHWVGTFGDDFRFVRAEFVSTWSGQSGSMYLEGTGELTLVKSRRIADEILIELKRGDEDVAFVGRITRDVMVGHLDRAPARTSLQLHRIVPVDRRRLAAYVGTYRLRSDWVRSIEYCAS